MNNYYKINSLEDDVRISIKKAWDILNSEIEKEVKYPAYSQINKEFYNLKSSYSYPSIRHMSNLVYNSTQKIIYEQ